LCISW